MRSAWHGPGDTSPVGHAANLMLDLNAWNFGIQEYAIGTKASFHSDADSNGAQLCSATRMVPIVDELILNRPGL